MNFIGCANCLLHGWKQVEDLSTLQRCTKCKLIQYCGRECQSEHWKRIHKKQCRYFADPVKAQKWAHNEEACAICLQAAKFSKAEICQATNPNYECILKEQFPTRMYHPHPFPVTGQPGHTYEKVTIILWQLLKKFEITQPEVISKCQGLQGELVKVFAQLKTIRLHIWKSRKISHDSDSVLVAIPNLTKLLAHIRDNMGSDESMQDLFRVIELVDFMFPDVCISEFLQVLINPVADIPSDLHTIVSQAMSNSVKYLAMANNVLDALTNQIVPYQDLVRIVCGGSLEKRCNFCKENISIASISIFVEKDPFVLFSCMSMEIYCCGTPNCVEKANPMMMMQEYTRILPAVLTTAAERQFTRCDFCSKLPPINGGHRCSKCLTVIYCSVTCRDHDREVHKDFCREDVEERKKKFGSSGRKQHAKDVVERVENRLETLKKETESDLQEVCEAVSKFKLKNATKKAKK